MSKEQTQSRPETNEADKQLVLAKFHQWHTELQQLLPDLADDITVRFDNRYLIPDTGTGGFAIKANTIAIAFDSRFDDRETQLNDLKGAYYHECFHLVQGFTGEDADIDMPPLHNAIYEGAATAFEREHAGTQPRWGDWTQLDNIDDWVKQVAELEPGFDWRKWKFYDPETGNRWIMYRVGTYVVDQALKHNPGLSIKELATQSAQEIYELSSPIYERGSEP